MNYIINSTPGNIEWLRQILTRCGRNNVLTNNADLWEVRDEDNKLVDCDLDFAALFQRAYNWEEDMPGFEGLLWWSPARCSGAVCLKGTRVCTDVIHATVKGGNDPLEDWDYITQEQIDAAVRYQESLK